MTGAAFLCLLFAILIPTYSVSQTNVPHTAISDVQLKGAWIYVYDSAGKRVSSMLAANKTIVGVASDFFVAVNGAWIETYDAKCNRIASMLKNRKEVGRAVGNSFTVKNGKWIETYDRNCKRTGSRLAQEKVKKEQITLKNRQDTREAVRAGLCKNSQTNEKNKMVFGHFIYGHSNVLFVVSDVHQ